MNKKVIIKIENVFEDTNIFVVGKEEVCKTFDITRPTLNKYLNSGELYKKQYKFIVATEQECELYLSTNTEVTETETTIETNVELSTKELLEAVFQWFDNDERYKTLMYDVRKDIVLLNEDRITTTDYTILLEEFQERFPKNRITKPELRSLVLNYARRNKTNNKVVKKVSAEWIADLLDFDEDGKVVYSLNNVYRYLSNHPSLQGKIRFNDFCQVIEYNGKPINDTDINELRMLCENDIGINTRDFIDCSVDIISHENSYNPFKEAIEGLEWDGIERMEEYFIKWVNVKDTPLNRTMTRKWFYALIKRLYEPGCKFDHMLIIHDNVQGSGKTTVVERLVSCLGIPYGVCGTLTCDTSDKDNVDKMNSSWIVSIDELTEFLKAEPEKTKQLITQTQDVARLPYQRHSKTYYRHCVFVGTTNMDYFLKDYTGDEERRYWVMEANGVKWHLRNDTKDFTDEYIQQVIAEAYFTYKSNPKYFYNGLSGEETESLIDVQQRHKTFNNDETLIYEVDRLMSQYYTIDEVYTYDQLEICLHNQREDNDVYSNEKLFDDIPDNIYSGNTYKQIRVIAVAVLNKYIEKRSNRTAPSTKYISKILGKNWKLGNKQYKNQNIRVYIRKEK